CDRALRRAGGVELAPATTLDERREVRQLAAREHLARQLRIHAVDTEHDHRARVRFLELRARLGVAARGEYRDRKADDRRARSGAAGARDDREPDARALHDVTRLAPSMWR